MPKQQSQPNGNQHSMAGDEIDPFATFLQLRSFIQQMKTGAHLWKWEYDNTVNVRYFQLTGLQTLTWTDPEDRDPPESGIARATEPLC
jgi:hypothetical protein